MRKRKLRMEKEESDDIKDCERRNSCLVGKYMEMG